jgi:hypothetical protein
MGRAVLGAMVNCRKNRLAGRSSDAGHTPFRTLRSNTAFADVLRLTARQRGTAKAMVYR